MRPHAPRLLGLLAVLLLAGCSEAPGPATESPPAANGPVVAPVLNETLPTGPIVLPCKIVRTAVVTPIGAGVHPDGPAPCEFANAPIDLDDVRSAVVEMTTSAQPTAASIHLRIQWSNCEALGIACDPRQFTWDAEGTDRVRVELGEDFFAAHHDHNPSVTAWSNGAAVDQEFDVYVSLFTAAVPAGYTAIPA